MRNSNSWKRRRLWSIVHLNQKVHRMVLESSNWLECTLGHWLLQNISLTVFCAILGKEEERFLHWRYQRCRRFLQKLAQLQVDLLILDHALPPYARYGSYCIFPKRRDSSIVREMHLCCPFFQPENSEKGLIFQDFHNLTKFGKLHHFSHWNSLEWNSKGSHEWFLQLTLYVIILEKKFHSYAGANAKNSVWQWWSMRRQMRSRTWPPRPISWCGGQQQVVHFFSSHTQSSERERESRMMMILSFLLFLQQEMRWTTMMRNC